jgi:cell division protein ZapA (FtsZ GTPase activity inhibitor)
MTLNLKILNSTYKINCPKGDEEKLINLCAQVQEKLKNLKEDLKTIDEKTIMAIALLSMQEELNELNSDYSGINKDDLFEALSDNVENINDYISKLGSKIQNL